MQGGNNMNNPKLRNAVYCPVCGLVLFWKCDALGNTIVPEQYFPGGLCTYCGHKIIDAPEPWSSFFIEHEKIEDEHYENSKYVIEHFVIPNPEYNRDAHIRRLEIMQNEYLNNGHVDKYIIREQREILGLDVETPTPKVSAPSSFGNLSDLRCPRCFSGNVTTEESFNTKRAVAGGLLAGITGAFIGGNTGKTVHVCKNCGHKWKDKR